MFFLTLLPFSIIMTESFYHRLRVLEYFYVLFMTYSVFLLNLLFRAVESQSETFQWSLQFVFSLYVPYSMVEALLTPPPRFDIPLLRHDRCFGNSRRRSTLLP